jgi:hypothetical protein
MLERANFKPTTYVDVVERRPATELRRPFPLEFVGSGAQNQL